MFECSLTYYVLWILLCGFHHLIHKKYQGVHKGTNMNERYSRLGWILTAIYSCPFAPPQSCENIRSAVHFTVKFYGGASNKSRYGWERRVIKILGDAEAWLLCACWSLLISAQPYLTGS